MLSLGFSPCPNDTFIFHALVHGLAGSSCPDFAEPVLADVETLNKWAMDTVLDVTKLSFHALGHLEQEYSLLKSGAALGRGCGPLLVAGDKKNDGDLADKIIAIPGVYTTAAMLLRLYAPQCRNLQVLRFEEIMPAIIQGKVDAGVIIHESRFTYPQYGLKMIVDLGHWWEGETGHPIPLGGIAIRKSLGRQMAEQVEACIRESVRAGFRHPDRCRNYIKEYAQELDSTVIDSHVGLYVNSFSEDLGREGEAAVVEFLRRGRDAGLF